VKRLVFMNEKGCAAAAAAVLFDDHVLFVVTVP